MSDHPQIMEDRFLYTLVRSIWSCDVAIHQVGRNLCSSPRREKIIEVINHAAFVEQLCFSGNKGSTPGASKTLQPLRCGLISISVIPPAPRLFRPQTRRPGIRGPHRHKAPTVQAPRCSTQRAGMASPHAEGDGLSGVTSDGETFAFISGPAGVVGGVPVTRAMNPWAMPAAST
jgi:hypothetical protein